LSGGLAPVDAARFARRRKFRPDAVIVDLDADALEILSFLGVERGP
jgi:hypothetical protein